MEHNFDNSDKWWLISDEAVTFIKAALAAPTHAANCYNCQDGLLEACCPGCDGDDMREAASYILDNSLRPAPDSGGDAVRVILDEEVHNEAA